MKEDSQLAKLTSILKEPPAFQSPVVSSSELRMRFLVVLSALLSRSLLLLPERLCGCQSVFVGCQGKGICISEGEKSMGSR
jgi:hypothetical protein